MPDERPDGAAGGGFGWQPDPGWRPLRSGAAPSTAGVWRLELDGRDAVAKRLHRPVRGDPPELVDPHSAAYWRRAADVAASGVVRETPGLCGPEPLGVEEDDEGVTVLEAYVPAAHVGGPGVAASLARFAGAALPTDGPPLASGQLRERVARVARRGGWTLLARTPVADLSDHLWSRREGLLARLDELPAVPQHGDPVPANLRGRTPDGETIVAVDWSTLGLGPVGADLGYWSLSAREELEPLLGAYVAALPPAVAAAAGPQGVALAARVTAAFTVLTRADWALSRVAPGDGPLAAKFRHPAVAPHLAAVERQLPHLQALIGS